MRFVSHRGQALTAALAGALWLAVSVGCDRTGESLVNPSAAGDLPGADQAHLVSASVSPRHAVDQCIRAYQKLTRYEDAAFVQLRYELDGKLLEDRAPLAVAYEAPGRLGIHAYSVQAGPTQSGPTQLGSSQGRWRARLRDDDQLIPNQILSRALPSKKINFEWLLSDPLVAERLAAGLAGFPPQLDLLLSDKPFQGLIDDSTQLSFLAPQSIDAHTCSVVKVQRGTAEFVLWIDQASHLLRRMQLPKSHLTEQMLADRRVSNMQLTIELADVRADTAVDWSRFDVDVSPDDLLVSRFVPQPLTVDTAGLGEKIPGFYLESPSGESVYNSSLVNRHRKATVLLWLADHPTCRLASEQLQKIASSLADQQIAAESVEFVSVWAEPNPPQGSTFQTLAADWKLPGKLALDRAAMGRDLFGVLEAPTLVIINADQRLQLRESRSNPVLDQVLPSLLARIVNGEDLAQEMISQQRTERERYQAELRMAASADAPSESAFPAALTYDPQTFRLRELSSDALPLNAIAATTDSKHTLWTLMSNGELQQTAAPAGMPAKTKHNTGWQMNDHPAWCLEVAPGANDVAAAAMGGSQVHLFNTATRQNRAIDLGSGATVVDFQWLTLGPASTPRLAVITREGRTVLIDPANREQLSGRSPQEPVALLALRNPQQAINGHVVLADGTLEPLQLSTDSLGASSRGPGRPIAMTTAATEDRPERVAFQPAAGTWLTWRDEQQELTLARGWLATDEPALFLLDTALNRRWHYRIPLQNQLSGCVASVAKDPHSGQPVWGIATSDNTIHLLRADGLIIDHFRPSEEVVGLALAANGERLELSLVHPRQIVRYAVDWR